MTAFRPLARRPADLRQVALAALAVALLAGCASDSSVETPAPGSAQAGRLLAQRECAGCHAIGELGRSPRDGAPPLREVLDDYSASRLEAAFREGMIVGHQEMPIYRLSEEEAASLLAYLRNIQE